ncbi:DMT family transporter [Serpentinimonas barnesii]|uniref:DMT family transporter n=1 Tax=Serpentinimonas barnesii TaxID=1458427 RepID=UPI000495DC89|nr:DMT family transporter [Serpentinimonas barnesii]
MNRAIAYALASALLFGASTPLAKQLLDQVPPLLLGGLLYLGAGLGLLLYRLLRDRGWRHPGLQGRDWGWLGAAIAIGGVLGTGALMFGLQLSSAASASLLLNLEAVFTALLAWLVFREHASRRVVTGMLAIVAGGLLLAWPTDPAATAAAAATAGAAGAGLVAPSAWAAASAWLGPLLVALACLCWAIDNNLTRKVAAADALFIAGSRGLVAGVVSSGAALALGAAWPAAGPALAAMLVGLLGYGVSLVLFVLALRGLGTARASAYFATAPFIGVALSLLLLGEATTWLFWLAGLLMAAGVWLHLGERHAHLHQHEAQEHEHWHQHDAHHQHTHEGGARPESPLGHRHWHRHEPLTHRHPHYPDTHHQHRH